MWILTLWYNRDLRHTNGKTCGCSSLCFTNKDTQDLKKTILKKCIFYIVIIQNIIKWIIIKFPQAVIGILILWTDTLKHYTPYKFLENQSTILRPFVPCSLWALMHTGFQDSKDNSFWQSTAYPFPKTKLKNSPNKGYS